jgi:antitoxin ParD1/3/4
MPSSYAVGVHFERFIKQQVESGRYSSASEVVRDALRLLEEQEDWRAAQLEVLRRQIQAGVESGPGVPATEVFTRLEAKYRALGEQPGS